MLVLSKPQMLIYDMEKYVGGTVAVICGSVLLEGEGEPSELIQAANEILRRNEVLRTQIVEQNGQILQKVKDFQEQEINILRFDSREALTAYAEEYAKTPVSLSGSLCELQVVLLPGHCGLLAKCHHIIGDAWTLTLIASQLCALLAGEEPPTYPYSDFVESEVAYAQSDRREKDKTFFLEQFKACQEAIYLSERPGDRYEAHRTTFQINADLTAQLRSYAKEHNTSAFVLFLNAFAVYFSRVKENVEHFYIGTPILNRKNFREKHTMGMFINTVPVLAHIDYSRSFMENLAAMQKEVLAVLRHQKFHYNEVLAAIRQEYGFTARLYDVVLSYQNAAVTGAEQEIETTWYHSGMQTESLQIHIDDRDSKGVFRIHLDYRTDKFAASEIQRMYGHILNLLQDAIFHAEKTPGQLALLSLDEKQLLLHDFNDTAADYPRDKCVHTLFEEQVERTPDKTAVIACDRTLTYQELNEEANRIAHGLIEEGVKPGDIVAFALPRDSHLIPTMFGILKAGAAYLPIDPDYPQKRIDYMLRDSEASVFVTVENLPRLLENGNSTNPALALSSESLCYCIYTSGSTGAPKGVLVRHNNVVNFCCNSNGFHNNLKECCDFVLASNDVAFDITLQEIHLPLINGKTIFYAKSNVMIFPNEAKQLCTFCDKLAIITTPTRLSLFLADAEMKSVLWQCQTIMVGAEMFGSELYQKMKAKTNAKIFNGYGPTETTCGTCYQEIASTDIAIGVPIANTQVYIVDKYMVPVPLGVTGELCIAGDGVGAGYLNRPELTAEKFIPNPFGEGKLYKTGDLAYWREDGNIVYVGRNDFQVKIRGLRIELGEIENAIAGVEGISQAVVVVRKNDAGRQLICAFYTETAPVELETVKSALREKLPRYMMPHIFTRLDTMPMTSSGKVNRKALPEVDLANPERNAEYIPPEGEVEKQLADIMQGVLNYSPIGREDNFFDLGGDSLKAIEFLSKAHSDGLYFSLQNVFDYPTVRQLRQCMEEGDKLSISYEDVDFSQINELLAKNHLGETVPPVQDVGNILLAGATGFLGIHILAEYLEHDSGTAYCLVRGQNQEESKKRLTALLNFYFGDRYVNLIDNRIQILCGDLQKDGLGLNGQEYKMLLENVGTVINAAASVKHYGSYQYFHEVNVETVGRLIAFCQSGHAKLIHISTLSVSGNSFGDDFSGYISETEKHFYESDLYIGQPLENVYARSKFEAEKLVLEAALDGLPVHIMRMGNLTNRQSDGVFQINHQTNAAAQRIKGILELGVVPDYLINEDMYVEFTPIDEAAQAIMVLVRHFDSGRTVFHINSTKVVYLDKLIDYFITLGYPLRAVPGDEFTAALRETAKRAGMEHIFETFINDLDKEDRLNYDSNIRIENGFTEEYLRRLDFDWGEIGLEYLRKYEEHFRKIRYWGGKNDD